MKTKKTPATPETLRLLLGWLAETFSLWEPIRNWKPQRRISALCELRNEYQDFGLAIRIGGTETARKSGERQIGELEHSGLIINARQNGRRSHVKLTDPTDWRLRSLAGMPGLAEAQNAMRAIRQLLADGYGLGGVLLENVAAGVKWRDTDPQSRIDLETDLNAALVRGWVVSLTSAANMVWYAVTESGLAALAALDAALAQQADDLPEFDQSAHEYFVHALRRARSAIDETRPKNPHELGTLPLPATLWATNPKLDSVLL